GLISTDNSCAMPVIGRSAASASRFRNAAYAGDTLGDGLDRTNEGYIEIVEMGTIHPDSALGRDITSTFNFDAPNASKPACAPLLADEDIPKGMLPPTGGLSGNISYVNINQGIDVSVDAIALADWSGVVQWSSVGSTHPDLSDANPPISFVTDTQGNRD